MVLLAIGVVAILVLLGHVMFGATAAVIVGIGAAVLMSGLWFLIPFARRAVAANGPPRP